MNENRALNQQLELQAHILLEQRQVQGELLKNVRTLQSELTVLKHQGSSSTAMTDYGAGIQDMQHQMVQILQDLSQKSRF